MPARLSGVVLVTAATALVAGVTYAASDESPATMLPPDWLLDPKQPAESRLWSLHPDSMVTYSYQPGRSRPGPPLAESRSLPPLPSVPQHADVGEKTYTVVEGARRELLRPLPKMAALFASALCGIGGLAWWRCQGRDEG